LMGCCGSHALSSKHCMGCGGPVSSWGRGLHDPGQLLQLCLFTFLGRTPMPDHIPPHTPETPPQTFEAGYSLREARSMSGLNPGPRITKELSITAHPIDQRRRSIRDILIGPIGQRGMNGLIHPIGLKGMTVPVHHIGQCTGGSPPQALAGTPLIDQGTWTLLPLAPVGLALWTRKQGVLVIPAHVQGGSSFQVPIPPVIVPRMESRY
jgi:hypothetical protein